MLPRKDGYISYYLMAGEYYFGGEPAVVQTVLGSCVAVTIYDRKRKFGGMCHCILPSCPRNDRCENFCDEGFKFVECSLRGMLSKFKEAGIPRSGLEVKMFGGADLLEHYSNDSIGKQNVDAALRFIGAENLNLVAFDVGESFGRKILFFTDTGEIYLKRLHKTAEGLIAPRC